METQDSRDPAAALDPAVLTSLSTDLGDDAAVQVVRAFLETLPERLREIQAAVEAGDPEALRRPAHTLKSAAQLVGASHLAELAFRAETAQPAPDLHDSAQRVAAELRGWLAQRVLH